MWNCNDKIMSVFDQLNEGALNIPYKCPVCGAHSGHIYIHKHDDKHCGIWIWCSSCGSYSHMSDETPIWWINPDFVDENQLCSEPEYLEIMKDTIDAWVYSIAPTEKVSISEPFIMEDKFNVKLQEDLQGISAGTTGILVIKNDFKAIEFEFIDESGNSINLNVQPEKVKRIFEIINR